MSRISHPPSPLCLGKNPGSWIEPGRDELTFQGLESNRLSPCCGWGRGFESHRPLQFGTAKEALSVREECMPRWPVKLLLKLFAEPRVTIGGAAATAEIFL